MDGAEFRRVETPPGPILVRPGARDRAVVYVHGYRDDVDSAVRRHGLAAQFPTDAAVLVPEAPSSRDEAVRFPDLGQLLSLAGVPGARVLAIGHSGAYRTLLKWLDAPELREVVLLDALYGGSADFERWARLPGRRLSVVGRDTAEASRALAARLGIPYHQGRSHDSIPGSEGWVARFVAASPTLRGSVASVLLVAVVAGLALYWLLS